MIIDSNNRKDLNKMLEYGKTKGMILVKKYFPKFFIYDRIVIINSLEDWEKIKGEFNDIFFLRADTKIGAKGVFVKGRWSDKKEIINYIEKVNEENKDAVIVCLEENSLNVHDMIYTGGAFNIHFHVDNYLYIDYVGPGFDASDLTKGKATHESWKIKYKDIPFLTSKTVTKYKTFDISENAYKNTVFQRKKMLLLEHPDRIGNINNLNNNYVKCKSWIIDLIIDNIIMPLWNNVELINYVGNEFGVQLNVLENGNLEAYEINRPERMKESK